MDLTNLIWYSYPVEVNDVIIAAKHSSRAAEAAASRLIALILSDDYFERFSPDQIQLAITEATADYNPAAGIY